MAKQSFISHVVNGYSRYDVPESKAFTCTPGILYPVRIDFINARDRVTIAQGIDVRSNPLAVPSFNPYTVRLHRFWVPLQLYHPEMRTNSSKFDFNNLSLNWIPNAYRKVSSVLSVSSGAYSNSLFFWLRNAQHNVVKEDTIDELTSIALPGNALPRSWSVADTYLAYWDIVRNYYSYSQWGLYSFAWPASWNLIGVNLPTSSSPSGSFSDTLQYRQEAAYFSQRYGNLEFLDAYFESQFYPAAVKSGNNTYNRANLWSQIIFSDLETPSANASDGYPVSTLFPSGTNVGSLGPNSQLALQGSSSSIGTTMDYFVTAHPMAVVPSNPDRFSRLLPPGDTDNTVSMSGITTIPQLAIASRMQEYKDLLGAGGNRYSDWLETFFASKIEHVDRPKLLFSASQTVNVQVVMNQAGYNNFSTSSDLGSEPLGQQGGSIAFNSVLGRSQSYYFREPGYLIDMISIRPVYYWAGITPDYLSYKGADYFNPIYNDIGYQSVPSAVFSGSGGVSVAREPCFNEFRSSYDEVLGQISVSNGDVNRTPLYRYWVQQRTLYQASVGYYPNLFVDILSVNSPFVSNVEDNFFINMSYSVRKKSLVNKTFATRLSNR